MSCRRATATGRWCTSRTARVALLRPAALVRSYEARPANSEGRGQVTMGALLKQSLRDSPDVLIVGETRGEDGVHLLDAASNGIAGVMCTIHSVSARGVFDRLVQMVRMADPPLPGDFALLAATSLDVIVHVARNRAHERFVTEVVQVHSVGLGENGYPVTEALFRPRRDGRAEPTGRKPTPELAERLLDVGFDLDWLNPGTSTWDRAGRTRRAAVGMRVLIALGGMLILTGLALGGALLAGVQTAPPRQPGPHCARTPDGPGGGAASSWLAVPVGLVGMLATGWVAAGVGAAAVVLLAPSLLRPSAASKAHLARLEALASWTRRLADLLASGAASTLPDALARAALTSPAAISTQTAALASRMGPQGVEPALRLFAKEIADPVGDHITMALIVRDRHGGVGAGRRAVRVGAGCG